MPTVVITSKTDSKAASLRLLDSYINAKKALKEAEERRKKMNKEFYSALQSGGKNA